MRGQSVSIGTSDAEADVTCAAATPQHRGGGE
jgi:hypothetical protein